MSKMYRKRGSQLNQLAAYKNEEFRDKVPVVYNAEDETLAPGENISLKSVNATDRLVVQGISYLNGDVVVDKGLSISGDLLVKGTTYTTDEQSIDTTSNYVILRHNNKSPLSNTEKSGIVVSYYNDSAHAALGVDHDGVWRVSDNVAENTTTYTNISEYGNDFYSGLTQDETVDPITDGATVSRDADEYSDVVWYNNAYYYHDNQDWFLMSLVDNKIWFDIDSPITDAATIAALDALDKKRLIYYREVTVLVIADTTVETVEGTFLMSSEDETAASQAERTTTANEAYWLSYPWTDSLEKIVGQESKTELQIAKIFTIDKYPGVFFTSTGGNYGGTVWKCTKLYFNKSGHVYYQLDSEDTSNTRIDSTDPNWYLNNVIRAEYAGNKITWLHGEYDKKLYAVVNPQTATKQNNQPILTRSEESDLTDGAPLVWDATNTRAVTSSTTDGNKVLKSVKNSTTGKITYEWSSSGSGAVWRGTRAELTTALLITDPNDEAYIPNNALLVITDESSYIEGEDQ